MVCATAMLGATFRSSISLVVIVVEGTRGIGERLCWAAGFAVAPLCSGLAVACMLACTLACELVASGQWLAQAGSWMPRLHPCLA